MSKVDMRVNDNVMWAVAYNVHNASMTYFDPTRSDSGSGVLIEIDGGEKKGTFYLFN